MAAVGTTHTRPKFECSGCWLVQAMVMYNHSLDELGHTLS